MKPILIFLMTFAFVLSGTLYGQQTQDLPTNTNTGGNAPSGTQTSPGDVPAPSSNHQTTPQTTPGTDQPVAQPFGTTPSNDPFQNQQKQLPTDPYNDYHLTRPSTSPMSGQNGTQKGTNTTVTPEPYNQDPGAAIQVEKSQLPAQMKQNLEDPKYTGWENSTIYYNRGSNQYSFDVGTGAEIKNYRFDRDGNPIQQTPESPGQTPATGEQ